MSAGLIAAIWNDKNTVIVFLFDSDSNDNTIVTDDNYLPWWSCCSTRVIYVYICIIWYLCLYICIIWYWHHIMVWCWLPWWSCCSPPGHFGEALSRPSLCKEPAPKILSSRFCFGAKECLKGHQPKKKNHYHCIYFLTFWPSDCLASADITFPRLKLIQILSYVTNLCNTLFIFYWQGHKNITKFVVRHVPWLSQRCGICQKMSDFAIIVIVDHL